MVSCIARKISGTEVSGDFFETEYILSLLQKTEGGVNLLGLQSRSDAKTEERFIAEAKVLQRKLVQPVL